MLQNKITISGKCMIINNTIIMMTNIYKAFYMSPLCFIIHYFIQCHNITTIFHQMEDAINFKKHHHFCVTKRNTASNQTVF